MAVRIGLGGAPGVARRFTSADLGPQDLGSRAATGDPVAWQALVRHYSPLLTRIAGSYGLSASDSGDVVQTAWLRLVQSIGQLRDATAVGAWLVTTVRREALACSRRGQRERLQADPAFEPEDPAAGPYQAAADADVSTRVAEALARIPARDRALLVLLTAGDRPAYQQVAAALQMPVGSIGATRARALIRLRTELVAAGIDDLVLAG